MLCGFLLARCRFPGRELLDTLLTLPMVMPPTVLGFYLLVLFGRRSALGGWLNSIGIELVFTWQGAVVAAAVVAFPLIFKPARAAFEQVEPQLEAAARCLGLSSAPFSGALLCRLPGAVFSRGRCSLSPAPLASSARR